MSARALRVVLSILLVAQVAILSAQHVTFFSELFRFPSRLAAGWPASGGSSLPFLLALLAAAALWAGRPWSWERFAAAGLAQVAAAGLSVYAGALALGSLYPSLAWAALVFSAALAAAARRAAHPARSPAPRVPLSLSTRSRLSFSRRSSSRPCSRTSLTTRGSSGRRAPTRCAPRRSRRLSPAGRARATRRWIRFCSDSGSGTLCSRAVSCRGSSSSSSRSSSGRASPGSRRPSRPRASFFSSRPCTSGRGSRRTTRTCPS